MEYNISEPRLERAIVDLHTIKTAGLEAEFKEYLADCFIDFNERQVKRTGADLLYTDCLGDDLAKMLGLDRATCRQQAKNYLAGSRALVVCHSLHGFAKKIPKRKNGGSITLTTPKTVRHGGQNAPANFHAGVENCTREGATA